MPRDLILGTAGHIDHGKTSLVKVLTGIDCDRLPEEKARGITIDIGFANLDLGDVRLGIVDVPGHERFVKNMLAGATGIDLALLVVAADDSVMPQTREHLEILKLLGIRNGLIALTKADLVDETTRDVVGLELRELVRGSFLEDAPIIPTSAHTGLGITELKDALREMCLRVGSEEPNPLTPFPKKEGGTEPKTVLSPSPCSGPREAPLTGPESKQGGVGEGLQPQPTPPSPLPEGKGEQARDPAVFEATSADNSFSPFPSGRGDGGVGSSPPSANAHRGGSSWFRLPIDRSFVVQGHGTVVTGSVVSGSIAVGDELEWHRGDGTTDLVRVRGLNNHGRPATEVHRGQRAAVNLAGVPHEQVRRGQELARPDYLLPSKVVTVRLFASAEGRHGIKHRLPVRLHVGTSEVMATVSLLDCDTIDPGQWGLAQLFLSEPVTTVWGQPFVLRDSSAEHTLGGGQVVQPTAAKVRRRHIEAIEQIEKLWSDELQTRALAVAWFAGTQGFEPDDLVRSAGVEPNQIEGLVSQLTTSGKLTELAFASNRRLLIHTERVTQLEARVLDTLGTMHAENPLMTTHDRQKVLARLDFVGDEQLLQAIADRLLRTKKVVGDTRRIARADFKPKLSANQRKLKDKIVEAHVSAGFAPPEPKEFANQAGGNATALKDIFEVACAEGFLVRVTDEIYLSAKAETEMRRRVTQRLQTGPGATVAEIRDLLGTTRKFAVPVCEYLDRVGLTKRAGDLRVLAEPAATG
ncbi:selenocysteine-specific translation elongation factor : Selenocysteine-specific elongation factor OS=uncultured planctomycete GN=HGMM_F37F03C06 PE=4 SV=1: GTP_EFTU: GTP_EFTU_D2: SelB-wing_3 [Gemmata massiliana]|uniref:Tr-type G domain-containing protein n=1 Tax=Gemmata massiliana TaxID=1210884 RepID=A0A6P2D1L6_9BACT|nr:SelB C-terminal domain-containing protein [Gemmata massiliana]VTR95013.1 selenocysteine-specific translation elongation factor : Selenocysteine-specific elongation factor OS=uncultured planctomycete GN=HGMM_F37F03C06 PE=4 SV=1: GTP_EFTU: GTP_EFTU_D2: SelB-wing_3 [Gemmata massiliana]